MNDSQNLLLYSTLACHLCEQALEEIEPNLSPLWCLSEIDIADDPQLMACYGVKIPVLYHPSSQQHLYWPFDRHGVADFLNKISQAPRSI